MVLSRENAPPLCQMISQGRKYIFDYLCAYCVASKNTYVTVHSNVEMINTAVVLISGCNLAFLQQHICKLFPQYSSCVIVLKLGPLEGSDDCTPISPIHSNIM